MAAKINRLYGMRCYEAGPMDRAPDGGVQWRQALTPKLQKMGITVLDPCNKPINVGTEKIEDRQYRQKLKADGNYDQLAKEIKLLRIIDLRMVDNSDFLIVNLDMSLSPCGTMEEIFWANRMKMPVLIYNPQGKQNMPDWLFGVFPHKHFFNTWDQLLEYLRHVNEDEHVEHMKRWVFFDYKTLLPKV